MRRKSGLFGIRGKLSQLEYEVSGRCRQIACIQKSMRELNSLLQKMDKRKK